MKSRSMVSLTIDRELWVKFRDKLKKEGYTTLGRSTDLTKLSEIMLETAIDDYLEGLKSYSIPDPLEMY